jgi:hypothetical protein
MVAGALLTPALLPWIPGKAFALKGSIIGLAIGIFLFPFISSRVGVVGSIALGLYITALSSFLAMNFTGSTPFTSPTGVEKEMRKAIPLQIAVAILATILWVGSAFTFPLN